MLFHVKHVAAARFVSEGFKEKERVSNTAMRHAGERYNNEIE
ncbi:hypothetical protein [Slackia faecicanis]|nr:hypothetical protein [Slackia faecicanis]